MFISKRCEYALRAVFELVWRNTDYPVKIHEIADAQEIPQRFLESILNNLKHAGFVSSKRGNEGGYVLARDPDSLRVAEIIEAVQGPIGVNPKNTRFNGYCTGDSAFEAFWSNVNCAVKEVCSSTTFSQLKQTELPHAGAVHHYCI